jgi:hypothetical protein
VIRASYVRLLLAALLVLLSVRESASDPVEGRRRDRHPEWYADAVVTLHRLGHDRFVESWSGLRKAVCGLSNRREIDDAFRREGIALHCHDGGRIPPLDVPVSR